MMRRAASFVLLCLCLGGCGARDCGLGIARRDCLAEGSLAARFPQDDAICRGYGLAPRTHDYAVCRQAKAHERVLTARETDYGVLNDPLTPDIRR